jgi:hypothetical protein
VNMFGMPDRTEAPEYYFTYIDQVGDGDIRAMLRTQLAETVTLLQSVTDEMSLHRYAAGKWTIRQVVNHLNDTERLFVFRALWFARGFDSPLPSFDPDAAVAMSAADDRTWSSHIDEFRAVRSATVAIFDTLPAAAWTRQGVASGNTFTVRALACIIAGHTTHHARILRTDYLRR